ncbi:MAG: hypothetical protein EBU90_16515 [Proteobacteria bacterium]|nr:hypothetical protein [Pseudomonadota bacterium]NBP16331.1 hypothetical protein [bacterium]
MKKLLIFLLISITISSVIKSADTSKKEPNPLQKCKIRNAAEHDQLKVLTRYVDENYTFKNITMNGQPLLATTQLCLPVVTLLLQGGADPLEQLVGKDITCFDLWINQALETERREKRNKKIEIVATMARHLFKQGNPEPVLALRKRIRGYGYFEQRLPELPTITMHYSAATGKWGLRSNSQDLNTIITLDLHAQDEDED